VSSTKFRLISKGHTSTAPVDCGTRAAVRSARKVGKWLEGCDLSGGQRGDTLPLGKLDSSRRRVCQQSGKERREDESFVQHLDVGSRRNTVLARNSRSKVRTIYRNFKTIHLPECSSGRAWQATNHVCDVRRVSYASAKKLREFRTESGKRILLAMPEWGI
jgi:hypothetical protein